MTNDRDKASENPYEVPESSWFPTDRRRYTFLGAVGQATTVGLASGGTFCVSAIAGVLGTFHASQAAGVIIESNTVGIGLGAGILLGIGSSLAVAVFLVRRLHRPST